MFLTTTWAFYIFCCDFKEKKVIQRKEKKQRNKRNKRYLVISY